MGEAVPPFIIQNLKTGKRMEKTEIPLLEMKGISKDFFGNQVLNDINFTLHRGEILGLVGENGAGKSTLMKILFGMEEILQTGGYGGDVLIDGKKVLFKSPEDALRAGIGMVHQEFSLLPEFTVAENILLNREPEKYSVMSELFGKRLNTVDRAEMQRRALKAISKLGIELDAGKRIQDLPVGYKQFTEIARELSKEDDKRDEGASSLRLLVLDEPTAVLSEKEAETLLSAMHMLSEAGIAIIFISHRLHEITSACDTVMVMRDGLIIKKVPAKSANVSDIASWMVGRSVSTERVERKVEVRSDKDILKVEHLKVIMPGEMVRDVSFSVKEGEIFGIGGLAGQGKIGIPNGIMGLYNAMGNVEFDGKKVTLNAPRMPLDEGMAFVSEDRRGVGLLLDESLEWNVAFAAMQIKEDFLKKIGPMKFRDQGAIEKVTKEYVDLLEIKCTSTRQKAKELSGGNQQKVCLAKAFALSPRLLFVSEPTRGIDIGAKALVLSALRRYNEEHKVTIVMVSSELEELRSICDRIAIIQDGRVADILPATSDSTEFGMLMVSKVNKEAN